MTALFDRRFFMLATGASPWYPAPHNTEAHRADSFSSVLVLHQSPSPRALLLIGALLHGLAPVADMNPASVSFATKAPFGQRIRNRLAVR